MSTQLKTRILNKIDSYTNWIAEGAVVLKKGEIGIAQIATSDNQLTPPAIGIKVGDGSTPYAQLPWIQAIAGDVSSFVKENLTTRDAFNTLVKSAASADISTLNSAIDGLKSRMTTAEGKITTLEGKVTTLQSTVSSHGTSIGSLNTTVTNLGNNKADKTQVATDIEKAKTDLIGTSSDSASTKTIQGALKAAAEAKSKADGAQGTANTALANAATAQSAAEAAQGSANTNAGKISTIEGQIANINKELNGGTDGTSVNARLAALEAKDTEHDSKIKGNTDAISAEKSRAQGVEANHEGRIATMENFWKAADNPTGTIDKLAEIVDYIANDQSGAIDMAKDIEANTKAINDEITARSNAIDTLKSNLLGSATYGTDTIASVKAAAAAASKKADDNLATAKTYAATQASNVLGKSGDSATTKTVYGAHAAAAAAASAASTADGKAVAAANAASTADGKAVAAQNAIDGLLASSISDANGVIKTIGFSNGKLTSSRKLIDMDDMNGDTTFIFYCGTSKEVI